MNNFSKNNIGLIWQNLLVGLNRKHISKLLEICEPKELIKDFYKYEKKIFELFGQEIVTNFKETFDKIEQTIAALNENLIILVSIFDKEYPIALKYIDDAPIILYCKGNTALLNGDILGVVGTRLPSRYGKEVAVKFVENLARPFTIASGMALGIDTIALKTALDNGGRGIAILGGGIDFIYPPENHELYNRLTKEGLVISEYGLGIKPNRYMFPERNRLISGLSKGVFIVEAGVKSGSLITAEHAMLQGKELFCVPANLYSKQGEGTNNLLYENKANIVLSPLEIAQKLNVSLEIKEKPSNMQLDFLEEKIVEALNLEELHFDDLLEVTKLSVADLSGLLAKLELFGYISKSDNNHYKL